MQAKIIGGHVQAFSGHNLVSRLSQLLKTWESSIEYLIKFIEENLPEEIETARALKTISDTLIKTITDNYEKNIKEHQTSPSGKNPQKPLGIPANDQYHDTISQLNFNNIDNTLQPLSKEMSKLETIINDIKSKSSNLNNKEGMPYKSYYALLETTAEYIRLSIKKIFSDYQKLLEIKSKKARK